MHQPSQDLLDKVQFSALKRVRTLEQTLCAHPRVLTKQPSGFLSNRREFLRSAAGLALGSTLLRSPFARATNVLNKKKVVVVTFGGGARDQETFAPEGQENIPNMMRELLPRATFFTQVVNRGILGHYVATASLATGVYETFNNFAAVPPENPNRIRVLP